jgi:hypothetical protein
MTKSYKFFKHKYGLLWLVFCFVALITLQNYQYQTPTSAYNKGFLERLDAEGHAIEKHVGKSDAYLRKRLDTEGISAASTFNDMAEAEDAIRTVLIKRGDLVQVWLDTERSTKKAFYHKMNKPVGRVLKREWNATRVGNQARVVLIRDNNYTEGFFILTAYPEIRK